MQRCFQELQYFGTSKVFKSKIAAAKMRDLSKSRRIYGKVLKMTQYILTKAINRGVKVWMRCDLQTEYTLLLCQGNLHCVLKELLCPFISDSVPISCSILSKSITVRNVNIFPTSKYFNFASGINYFPKCPNLFCTCRILSQIVYRSFDTLYTEFAGIVRRYPKFL